MATDLAAGTEPVRRRRHTAAVSAAAGLVVVAKVVAASGSTRAKTSWPRPRPNDREGSTVSAESKRPKPAAKRAAARSGSRRPAPQRSTPSSTWLVVAALSVAGVIAGLLLTNGAGKSNGPPPPTTTGATAVTGADFHSLLADPTTPGRLFAGGHTAVSVSTDGGRTWRSMPSLENADAMGWGVVGTTVFVSGHPGLHRSVDGGASFRRVNDGLPSTDVHAFGAGGAMLYGASPAAGVFASADGGRSWRVVSTDTGPAFFGRILVDARDDRHLVAADVQAGPVASSDGGRTWQRLGAPGAAWVSGTPDLTELVASGPFGAVQSEDGGTTWHSVEVPDGATIVELSASDPSVLYAGIHRGQGVTVLVSRDDGGHWARP